MAWGDTSGHTRAPTVRPAAMLGTEPVRINPIVPPTLVSAPRMYAGVSETVAAGGAYTDISGAHERIWGSIPC